MFTRLFTAAMLAVLAGCSSSATSPSGDGGPTGGSTGGTPAPVTAAVSIGNNEFRSAHNNSANAAVDTVATGGTVTWTWTNTGSVPHSVQSLGSTIFRNSTVQTGNGSTYSVVFNKPGTYQYDCAVHGAAMTGTIVVR